MPIVSMIVAMGRNRVIGNDGQLPWRLPADMAWFREQTMAKPVIMGRKTYESISPRFRPLKGRHNIVLTRNPAFEAEGVTVVNSAEAALAAAGDVAEILVAGGSQIYELFLPHTQRLYLTLVDAEPDGDALFPELDWSAWEVELEEAYAADERHPFDFKWLILERKAASFN